MNSINFDFLKFIIGGKKSVNNHPTVSLFENAESNLNRLWVGGLSR